MSVTNRFPLPQYAPVHSVPGLFVYSRAVADIVLPVLEGMDDAWIAHFNATLERAKHQLHAERLARGSEALLCLTPRTSSGWLEFTLLIFDEGASRPFTIGCIQRRPGAESEFHS